MAVETGQRKLSMAVYDQGGTILMRRRIGVIGSGACPDEIEHLAAEVGREIAQRGGILVCGGLGGVMEGAARGAKAHGGLTVGIIPGETASHASSYIDIPIVTGLGIARNIIVVRSSEVLIAIHGQYGTLSEIAFALQLNVPVVGLNTWEVSADIIPASNPADAVEKAFSLVKA
jgi:uncharacterized protein (TIGR00725 family)